MPGFCFLSGWGLEPVRRADIDNDGVPALHKAGYIILGGLDHPFEAGRNVPVAGDREVRAAAELIPHDQSPMSLALIPASG